MKIYRLPAVSCNVIFFNSDETIFSSFLFSFSDSSIYTRSYVSLRFSPPPPSSFLFSSSRPLICNKREEKKRKTKRMMRCKPPKFISSSSHLNLSILLPIQINFSSFLFLSIPPPYFYQFLLSPNFVLKREKAGSLAQIPRVPFNRVKSSPRFSMTERMTMGRSKRRRRFLYNNLLARNRGTAA